MKSENRIFTREEMLEANRQYKKEWRDKNADKVIASRRKYADKVKKALALMKETEKYE